MSRSMNLSQLLPDVALARDPLITGLVMDSRGLHPGDAFVAIAGFGTHGLAFAEQVRARGAAAVLFEPPAPAAFPAPADAIAVPGLRARLGTMGDCFHGHPSHALTMVGVTGTNGKTSTVQLLTQAWHLQGTRCGSIGTLGAGLYGEVVPTGFTTPLVLQVHAMLAQLRDAGAQALAMEASSHALDQGRVAGVHFDIAVFTNLTRDHLDYHRTMQAYGAAKARLFATPGLQAAVINLDDGFGRGLFERLPDGVRGIGVSAHGAAGAALQAHGLGFDVRGIAFELDIAGERQRLRSPLLGRFNVDNLLAVAGVLHAQGVSAAEIGALLGRLRPVKGRMNRLGGDGTQPLVVVDFAHTPDALQQALDSLHAHAPGRVTCVFGCGGERDTGKRPQMAAIAEARADRVIVTDDNPRRENGDVIVADIMAGFSDPAKVSVQRDRARAITAAIAGSGPHDIVLVAGKGHEPYQDIAGVKHPFDDTEVAQAALAASGRAAPAAAAPHAGARP